MPNIWAHIQFGREVLETIDWAEKLDDPEWRTSFQLGCQGPDFLFYHHFWPWQPASAANRLGTLMHNENCGPFLLDLLEEAAGTGADHPFGAFAFGFLLHHVLDRHLHPFVFSLSGFRKWDHQRFETAMDAVLLQRRAGIDTRRTPVAPEIDSGGRVPGGQADLLREIALRHYPVVAASVPAAMLDESVRQMIAAQKLFYDPSGWKRRLLLGQLEPFSPPRGPLAYDVLNDAKRSWIDPTDRTVRHASSATELWERALEDGKKTSDAAIDWLKASEAGEREERKRAFARELGNVSYETGMPCGTARITYAEPIL